MADAALANAAYVDIFTNQFGDKPLQEKVTRLVFRLMADHNQALGVELLASFNKGERVTALMTLMREIHAIAQEDGTDISREACCPEKTASEMGLVKGKRVRLIENKKMIARVERTDLGDHGNLVAVRMEDNGEPQMFHQSMLEFAKTAEQSGWETGMDAIAHVYHADGCPFDDDGDDQEQTQKRGKVVEIDGDMLFIQCDDGKCRCLHYLDCSFPEK